MQNFWDTLPKPFFGLAPMEDITDAAFRKLVAQYRGPSGAPHVLWTEFTAADGLLLADEEGKAKLMKKLSFSKEERPVVAQLFTAIPEHMERCAALVQELGFDGLDINMGCPDRAIEKQGCGAALIKNHALAVELIHAARRGAPDIPLSIKTRSGWASDKELDGWVRLLLAEDVAALTLHARTRKDMSKVPARWELVKRAVEIRNELGSNAKIIGNGDVTSLAHGRTLVEDVTCDGIMIGRAALGNPWIFAETIPTKEERIEMLLIHIEVFEALLGDHKHFVHLRKHAGKYLSDFEGAKEMRSRIMSAHTPKEVRNILEAAL